MAHTFFYPHQILMKTIRSKIKLNLFWGRVGVFFFLIFWGTKKKYKMLTFASRTSCGGDTQGNENSWMCSKPSKYPKVRGYFCFWPILLSICLNWSWIEVCLVWQGNMVGALHHCDWGEVSLNCNFSKLFWIFAVITILLYLRLDTIELIICVRYKYLILIKHTPYYLALEKEFHCASNGH